MKYSLVMQPAARRQFRRLDELVQERVRDAILQLCDTPRPRGCVKITDEEAYRIRVGDYRVKYEIHDRTITVIVVKIAHRKDAYRA